MPVQKGHLHFCQTHPPHQSTLFTWALRHSTSAIKTLFKPLLLTHSLPGWFSRSLSWSMCIKNVISAFSCIAVVSHIVVVNLFPFKILLLTFKVLHNLAPLYLSELLTPYSPNQSLRSSNCNLLTVPRTKLSPLGGRSFSAMAHKL